MKTLAQLRPGTRLQLYKRFRDGTRRTPLRFAGRELAGIELTVEEVNPTCVIVSCPDGMRIPLSRQLRIREARA